MTLTKPNILNCYIAIYVIYILQGVLYASGSILSQTLVLVLLAIGLYGFFKVVMRLKSRPRVLLMWSLFFLVNALVFLVSDKVVYGTKYEAIGAVSTFGLFKNTSVFLLSVFIPYLYVREKGVSDKFMRNLALLFIVIAIARYFHSLNTLLVEYKDRDGVTNNAGYVLAGVLPYLLFVLRKHKVIAIIAMVVLISLILTAAKRGAILCMFACIAFALWYWLRNTRFSMRKYLLVAVAVVGIGLVVYQNYKQNEYLQYRLEKTEKEGAGARDVGYAVLWNHWVDDNNLFTKFLGNGTSQTITVWGNYAHNDWLEILIDTGLLGALLYASMFVTLYRCIARSQLEHRYRLAAYLCLIIWFLKTVFSMGYVDLSNVTWVLYIGIFLGNDEYKRSRHGLGCEPGRLAPANATRW